MAIKKVFIAGAICSHCGAIDRIQRCKDDACDDYWMECRVCGMRQSLATEEEAVAADEQTPDATILDINALALKHREHE